VRVGTALAVTRRDETGRFAGRPYGEVGGTRRSASASRSSDPPPPHATTRKRLTTETRPRSGAGPVVVKSESVVAANAEQEQQ